jgi:hypothetical protein
MNYTRQHKNPINYVLNLGILLTDLKKNLSVDYCLVHLRRTNLVCGEWWAHPKTAASRKSTANWLQDANRPQWAVMIFLWAAMIFKTNWELKNFITMKIKFKFLQSRFNLYFHLSTKLWYQNFLTWIYDLRLF